MAFIQAKVTKDLITHSQLAHKYHHMLKKLVISGDLIEFVEYGKDTNSLRSSRGVCRGYRVAIPLFGRKRYDNLARARSECVRRMFTASKGVREGCFITFTFDEKNATNSYRVAGSAFGAFVKRLRRQYKNRYSVIAVPERHKSGRVHIHALLFGGKFESEVELQTLARFWGRGFIKVKGRNLTPQLIFYVAKYITKQEDDPEIGSKCYWSSQGIDKSVMMCDDNAEGFFKLMNGVTISSRSRRSVYFGEITRTKLIRT